METARRSFFGTLLAGTAAAQMLDNVPEPVRVEQIPANSQSVFVMYMGHPICTEEYEGIHGAWRSCFVDGKVPPLLILDPGMRLEQVVVNHLASGEEKGGRGR